MRVLENDTVPKIKANVVVPINFLNTLFSSNYIYLPSPSLLFVGFLENRIFSLRKSRIRFSKFATDAFPFHLIISL
jgi:hypothetical protein